MKDTKSYILETSFKLFLQKSFRDVTMKEIVEKTGLSKGAFYHYFTSKEQLFCEIIEEYFFSKAENMYDNYNYDSLSGFFQQYIVQMESFIEWFRSQLGDDNSDIQMNYYMLMFEALNRYPGFRERITFMHVKEKAAWEKIIRIAREKGEIRLNITDEQAAQLLIYSGDGVAMHSILEGSLDFSKNKIFDLWSAFYNLIKT